MLAEIKIRSRKIRVHSVEQPINFLHALPTIAAKVRPLIVAFLESFLDVGLKVPATLFFS